MSGAAYLLASVRRAAVLLGILEELGDEIQTVMRVAGIDPVHAALSTYWGSSTIRFSREQRTTFSCKTDVEMELSFKKGETTPSVSVRVSWASNGGSVSQCLAVLNHHQDLLRAAALAEEILNDACRSLTHASGQRLSPEQGRQVFLEAGEICATAHQDAQGPIRAWREAKKPKAEV